MKTWEEKNVKERELWIGERTSVIFARQQRPYTFVELDYSFGAVHVTGMGFSKVCHPDDWNSELGKKVAITRAIRHIRKQLEQNES